MRIEGSEVTTLITGVVVLFSALAASSNKENQAIEPYLTEQVDLKTKLEHFNCHVICEKLPKTSENKRLLRPAMMEALLEFLPETVWEFKELIPPFLREGTASSEGKYIEQVLEIIREYEIEV